MHLRQYLALCIALALATPSQAAPVLFDSFETHAQGATLSGELPEVGDAAFTLTGTATVTAAASEGQTVADLHSAPAKSGLFVYGPALGSQRWERLDFVAATDANVVLIPVTFTGTESSAQGLPALTPTGPASNPWQTASASFHGQGFRGSCSPSTINVQSLYPAWDPTRPFHLEARWNATSQTKATLQVRAWNGDTAPDFATGSAITFTLTAGSWPATSRAALAGLDGASCASLAALAEYDTSPNYPQVLPATDAGFSYSGRWATENGTECHASSAGQRLRFAVTGDWCYLRLRGTGVAAAAPAAAFRIDGGGWTRAAPLPAGDGAIRIYDGDRSWGPHLVEVMVAAVWPYDAWATTGSRFMLQAVSLAPGGAASPVPYTAPKVVFLGDSIMVGHLVMPAAVDSTSTGQCDATQSMPSMIADLMGVDSINVSQPGMGFLKPHGAKTALPFLQNTLSGVPWKPDWQPAAVVINLGTNDGSAATYPDATLQAAVTQYLQAVRTMFPGAAIYLLRPLNGSRAAVLKAGFDGASLRNAAWVDTTGWLDTRKGRNTTDTVHPNAGGNARYAQQIASLLSRALTVPNKDANGDGSVTVADAVAVMKAAAGLP